MIDGSLSDWIPSANRHHEQCASFERFSVSMCHIETDVVDFLWPTVKTVVEGLHYLNIGKSLRLGVGLLRGSEWWQARHKGTVAVGSTDPQWFCGKHRPTALGMAARWCHNHIPDYYPIHTLFAGDDFGA